GGNSFLAARLMAALGRRFRDLPRALPAFLENPTVEHLARLIEKNREEKARERSKLSLFQQMKLWRSERKRLDAAWEAGMAPGGMRAFIILWIGQLVSGFGTGLGAFSLGVWTFDQNFSATQYAMVGLAAMLAGMLMTPVAGSVADRFDRRMVILFGDSCAACMTLLMAVLLYFHLLRVWHVYPIAILMTAFSALQGPAFAVSISALVPRRQLVRASAMSGLIGTVTGMSTPLLAGALVPKIGYHGVILIDFCTFLVGAATLLSVRFPASAQPVRQPGEKRSVLGDLAFGWSYLRLRPGLLSLLVLFALTNFSAGIVQSLLLPLIRSFASTTELGTVQSSAAFGALLGSLALSAWGGPPPGWRVWGIFVCMIVQGSLLFLGGVQPSVPLVACALFLAMFTGPIVGGSSQAIWMTKIGLDVQGRIFGIRGLIGSSTIPLAYLLAGPLADRVFGPLLMPHGPLADSVGRLVGVGPGRGIGLLFVVLGLFINLVVILSFFNPRLRKVEEELPDVVRNLAGGGGAAAPPAAPAGAEGRAA
ncbi:MAG TPA: MFS transporter, partial [Thermoanaerobaculia bacterium]|nr:MFS transporter [Thermoanaerobaculia bacterium]